MKRDLSSILVTGGAGFIGSAFIRYLLSSDFKGKVVNFDLLTYAGNLANLKEVERDNRYVFEKGDIRDEKKVLEVIERYKITTIVNFAAESHVDRSIVAPQVFVDTNIFGTYTLLEVLRKRPTLHLHHISTDEVYGTLQKGHFTEESPYLPNSPYAASKAAADHLVRAYNKTYKLSTTLSHSSNNFGPYQFPEKLIPLAITKVLASESIPIYGSGENKRDWLYVDDHVEGIYLILQKGESGSIYDMGGGKDISNLELIHLLLKIISPKKDLTQLISFVKDRAGHDFRYAIDFSKIKKELGWEPRHTFEEGLKFTIKWYLEASESYRKETSAH